MKNILGGHITRTSDEIEKFSTKKLAKKMYNSIFSYKEFETRINEFNNDFRHTSFNNKLAFQLKIAIMKHSSPIERIKWESNMIIPWLMNEINNDPYSNKINCIMSDFLNIESKKSMKRILTKKDVTTTDGKVLKDLSVFDYSIVDSHDQFENYKSILFKQTNHDFIKYYYRNFLQFFPVTLAEFEKTFFFFLTFLATKQYPLYTEINDVYQYVGEINELLRMRYIDIHDKVIMALIHIINSDPELQCTCKNIYQEVMDIENLTRIQFENLGS